MNLIIGKNSMMAKSMSNLIEGTYISYLELDDINSDNFNKIYLLSFPEKYKVNLEKNFEFEKKVFSTFRDKEIFIFSTSKVYPYIELCNEMLEPEPNSCYAENKLYIEKLVTQFTDKYFILRISNVFSNKNWATGTFFDTVNSTFVSKGIIKFDVSFNSIRDFITTESLSEIIIEINHTKRYGVYNVGSQTGIKIEDVLKLFFKKRDYDTIEKIQTSVIKSQTLNIDKLSNLININHNDIHKNVLKELGGIK